MAIAAVRGPRGEPYRIVKQPREALENAKEYMIRLGHLSSDSFQRVIDAVIRKALSCDPREESDSCDPVR